MNELKVLVADDEAEMRRAIECALTRHTLRLPDGDQEFSFSVRQASSGEETLEMIAADPPDLLLLDHKMGGMSGLDVLDRLNQSEHDMLTVMITAYASLEAAVTATKRGAFDFIAKPFTPVELKETVRKAIGHLVAQRRVRQLEQEKRRVRFEFISVLAHELKAPLNAIEGYLNILKDPSMRQDAEAVNRMVGRSLIRCEGMRKMIYDLLDLTRIESGTRRREFSEVDVTEVAQAALEAVRAEANTRSVTLRLHASGPLTMSADRSEMEIIMNNLVTNAVKYNRDGGRVEVTLSGDEEEVVIQVADTGIGLTSDEAAKLFRDFVRIKNRKTRDILGSGLGLSTVKKLALLYGGDATVSSTPDVGSTFRVRLKRDAATRACHDEATGNTRVAARG